MASRGMHVAAGSGYECNPVYNRSLPLATTSGYESTPAACNRSTGSDVFGAPDEAYRGKVNSPVRALRALDPNTRSVVSKHCSKRNLIDGFDTSPGQTSSTDDKEVAYIDFLDTCFKRMSLRRGMKASHWRVAQHLILACRGVAMPHPNRIGLLINNWIDRFLSVSPLPALMCCCSSLS
eukprot:TRINITY_DN14807_c0_g1_i1.p1 TRINITY_DN14807_c0_g1~~TRINITY_DN14807_c0_g1_i1.p1  ORF type:complete len:179 (-),score=11.61 TRINITY_DN14807_c0_g1_i1:56-592(-)